MGELIISPTPYKGLVPFEEADAPFFFGRTAETEIIIANLMAARLTLLYGASGVGKTSVLRAGVAHRLREQAEANLNRIMPRGFDLPERKTAEFGVVYFNEWNYNPVAMLEERVAKQLTPYRVSTDDLPFFAPTFFPEFLEAWSRQIDGDLLIILDQFEEYFLYHPQEEGAGTFFDEFPRALNRRDLRVSFLVAMREDALAKLDRFKGRIPNLFDNYLRIEHLDRDAARDAIEKPLTEYNRLRANEVPITIEPALVDAVLDQVKTGQVIIGEAGRGVVARESDKIEIETPYLQLVMTRLWDETVGAKHASPLQLRVATLNALGGAEKIVRTHLDETMRALTANEQDDAAGIFNYLVTPSGLRIAHNARDLAEYAGLQVLRVALVLEKLSSSNFRILRPVVLPNQLDVAHFEIFHDVLAPAIIDWHKRHIQARSIKKGIINNLRLRGILWRSAFRLIAIVLIAIASVFGVLYLLGFRIEIDSIVVTLEALLIVGFLSLSLRKIGMLSLLRTVLFIVIAVAVVFGAIRLLGLPFEFVSFVGGLMMAVIVGLLSFQFNNWWSSVTRDTPIQIGIPGFIELTRLGLGFAIVALLVLVGMYMIGFRFTLLFWIVAPLVTFLLAFSVLLLIPKS